MTITWTPTTSPFDAGGGWAWRGKWIARLNLFVVVGFIGSGTQIVCATSPDGVTYTGQGTSDGSVATVMGDVDDDGTVLVVARNEGVYTSPDGVTWTFQGNPLSSQYSAYSDDHGVTWTEVAHPEFSGAGFPVTVCVGPGGRIVVGGIATFGPPRNPWEGSSGTDGFFCIRYLDTFSEYVAIGDEPNPCRSADATAWTAYSSGCGDMDDGGNSLYSVVENPTYGYVMVGNAQGGFDNYASLGYESDPTISPCYPATIQQTPFDYVGGEANDQSLAMDVKYVTPLSTWVIVGGTNPLIEGDWPEQPSAIWEGTDGVMYASWTADTSAFDLDGETSGYGMGVVYDTGAPAVLALGMAPGGAGPSILSGSLELSGVLYVSNGMEWIKVSK